MKDDRLKAVSNETRKAIEPIYKDYYLWVLNYVTWAVKNRHNAEIVTSDVFGKIMNLYSNPETRYNPKRLGKNGTPASLATWVRTVTISVVLDYFKTNHQDHYKVVSNYIQKDSKYPDSQFQFVASSIQTPEKIVINNELKTKLDEAFEALKPQYKKIATLFFLEGQSYIEISKILNVPMGTVKGILSRAKKMLQTELKEVQIA